MSVGGTGEHVAGVALMPRSVSQDVAAGVCGEEPVGDVDGDALLALGAQPIGQGGQIRLAGGGRIRLAGGVRDRLEVVERQAGGVVQQSADQCALAVINRPCGRDAQQLTSRGHQKYPSRLRSSIAAEDVRSSARVSPRSETVAAEISTITPSMSVARERTAPVIVRS